MKTNLSHFLPRVFLVVLVTVMVACSWLGPLESAANEQVDAGLKRALASFAIARGLNAALSLIEGAELAIQPLGVGIRLSVGQVLRPLNDVVEQFAHLMLVASVAFGIEKILISIGAHWMISLLLTTAAIGWAYFYLRRLSSPAWLTRIFLVLLMTRFAMPIVIIGSDLIFQKFMADDYTKNQQVIEVTAAQISDMNSTLSEDQSIWGKGKEIYEQIKSKVASLTRTAGQLTERIIKVMVVFILQTLVLPIFLLWALWGLARGAFEVPPRVARSIAPRPATT